MIMQRISFLLMLQFFCVILYGQATIKGIVKNNANEPIAYLSVRLLSADSSYVAGTVTDTLGRYQFTNINSKYRSCLLAISGIGYKSQMIPIEVNIGVIEIPVVTLEEDNVMLGEVIVKGSSFIRKEGHVLVIPDKQQVKHANTGYDLLYNLMIPSIDVNKRTGEVTTFGDR